MLTWATAYFIVNAAKIGTIEGPVGVLLFIMGLLDLMMVLGVTAIIVSNL